VWGLIITSGALLAPEVSIAGFDPVEADARTVPWPTVRRLALEAGEFPPAYQPVTEGELAALLGIAYDRAMTGAAPALAGDEEFARLEFWLDRYQRGGGGRSWYGCSCKVHPPQVRLSGRAAAGFTDLGNPFDREAGLAWAPGWNATFEPLLDFSAGPWWAAVSGRFSGQVAPAGVDFSGSGGSQSALTWPGWSIPTGKSQVRSARLQDGAWDLQAPRALVGVTLGRWSLSAGQAPRTTGPGLTGALSLDRSGFSFPAVTARRMAPFHWGGGFWDFIAPDDLLLMTGLLTEQMISYRDEEAEHHEKLARPWFFQWLVGWRLTSWFRTTLTSTAMAVPREGTLWGDILQINFPLIGTTWSETTHGPVTDRIFSAQFEARWRHAPWPLLPAAAGRVFWDYAGTDYLPGGPWGLVPQISIPASVIGFEMVDPNWDVGLEYSELVHENVLWYSNSGFAGGYSNEGWLMGDALGGSGEAWAALVRVRPRGRGLETGLRFRTATWGMPRYTPGTGAQTTLGLSVGRLPAGRDLESGPASPLLWEITAEWNREKASPDNAAGQETSWWRVYFKAAI